MIVDWIEALSRIALPGWSAGSVVAVSSRVHAAMTQAFPEALSKKLKKKLLA